MLTPARRTLAAALAALMAAPALAVGFASAAQADAVRQQELWVLDAVDVAGAWQATQGRGVTVALIDSGVNGQVSDLAGSVKAGRDFSGVNTPPANANWGVHGTWMASLIAGHGHPAGTSSGIEGVAPAATILSIRAVTDQGDPGYRHYQHESEAHVQGHLADAIQYATSKHVGVISMSLGYQGASLPVRAAIRNALAQGIVVVASSGNSGGTPSAQHGNAPYSFPADYPGVLGVGAVSQSGQPAGFSSDNLSVQVAAPGVRVPAQGRDGQYWLVSGTSPACALTAGVAALIKSRYPALAPALVVQAITASTSHKPRGGYDEAVGFGTVDATAALKMAGRLARDESVGHGQVAAAQFGGGTTAIPPVPVAPRGRRQLMTDSLLALACLALVVVAAFRLIVTRRPVAAGVHSGAAPTSGGPSAVLPSGVMPSTGMPSGVMPSTGMPSTGMPSMGMPSAGLPGGAGYAQPPGYRPAPGYGMTAGFGAPAGYGQPPGAGPPTAHGQPRGPRQTGYGPAPDYGTSQDGAPPAGSGPAARSGSPEEYGSPAGRGTRDGLGSPAGLGSSGSFGSPDGPGSSDGYGSSGGPGAPDGYRPWGGYGPPDGLGPTARFGSPDGYRSPDGHGLSDGSDGRYGPPAGHGPAVEGYGSPNGSGPPGGFGSPDGYPPGRGARPTAASGPPGTSDPSGRPPEDHPLSDDDTWPSPGQW